MNFPFDPIALTLVPSVAFAVAAMWHFCDLTKDHKRSWVGPGLLALGLGTAGTFQAAVFGHSTPLDFVAYGAFYAPTSLWAEPWRFVTSIFLYDDPVIVLFTSLTVAIVGSRLAQHVGLLGVVFTFVLTSMAGTILVASADPQALVMGATAGAFGLAFATLLIGGWRARENVERIARATALAFVVVAIARFSSTQNSAGALSGAGGAAAAFFTWLVRRQASPSRRAVAIVATPLAVVLSTLAIPESTDLVGLAEMTRRKERETWLRLATLDSARANTWIGDGEFAERLASDVILPLEDVIDSSASWSGGRTKWIVTEHDRLINARVGLNVVREIFATKQKLVDAEAAEDEITREKRLDEFWNSLPAMESRLESFDVGAAVKESIDADLAILRRTANDIEIWSLESALVDLRERVVEEGPRSPASTFPWNEIRTRWQDRRSRLERLDPEGPDQVTRIQTLKERLARAIEAIE